MGFVHEKVRMTCETLKKISGHRLFEIEGIGCAPYGYKHAELDAAALSFRPFDTREVLLETDSHCVFRFSFDTPAKKDGISYVLEITTERGERKWTWPANPQGMLFLNGQLTQGLDSNHNEAVLAPGTHYDALVHFYTGSKEGNVNFIPFLKEIDTRIERLYYDLKVPYEAAMCFLETDYRRIRIFRCLETALAHLDLRSFCSDAFLKSVEETISVLERDFYSGLCGQSESMVSCVGHTHIDVAWLWTLGQTREKAQRTFSGMLALMEQYPEFLFFSSQPQLYQFVKQCEPKLYERIKQAVKDGRWEVDGAMWLEADCNIPSGESLVRQILHGKRFMKEEFGIESKFLWLPDVFGYSAALPQILKKSGIEAFVTSKISWNETNKMPYDEFMWQGIDGTEIFSYFITTPANDTKNYRDDFFTTYNGYLNASKVLGTWERFQQKEYGDHAVIPYGFGDGGGGPTKDMLENQRRLHRGILGIPKTEPETAGAFLSRARAQFDENCARLKRTPRWVGELYLEFHRGTYTSIAQTKRNNRTAELLFQKGEALCVMDAVLCGGTYPKDALHQAWETTLLNQFHDIIPGSSIYEVYEESNRQMAGVIETVGGIADEKLNGILEQVQTDGGLFVYNPNGFFASGPVEVDGKTVYAENIPAMGYAVVQPSGSTSMLNVTGDTLENDYFKLHISEDGGLDFVYDKRFSREVGVPGGVLNDLQAFEDFPKKYDAWEITDYYKQKMWHVGGVVSREAVYEGERAGVKITRKFLRSTIVQTVYLYRHTPRIDFVTDLDWAEEHILLKAAFPLDVHATEATYDIQFGNLKRPTHQNTSWDAAKFEVCAHKWADISEDGYGVSILNDCKYGYSAEGSTLSLTLLKCATYPNPHADKGKHHFTYSLYPHGGGFREGNTVQAAHLLNQPLVARQADKQSGALPERFSFISCDAKNIVLETVKRAEDGGAVIARLYECFDRRTEITVQTGFSFTHAVVCNLMEQDERPLASDGTCVTLPIGNYEIVTLKFYGVKGME